MFLFTNNLINYSKGINMHKLSKMTPCIKGASGGPRHCIWTPDCPLKLSEIVCFHTYWNSAFPTPRCHLNLPRPFRPAAPRVVHVLWLDLTTSGYQYKVKQILPDRPGKEQHDPQGGTIWHILTPNFKTPQVVSNECSLILAYLL